MRGRGAGEAEILAELLKVNVARCVEPLDESELRTIAASAARYEPNSVPAGIEASGAVHPAPIERVREIIARWLYVPAEDLDAIDFCLAVVVSNRLPGDPVWGLLIDASGGGKTELLRSLRKRPETYFLSSLTDKTLVSGYRDPKHPKDDPSLLPRLHGKVLIIKDLSPLLSMRRETRNTIMSDLRDAYDGFTDQGRGNLGRVSYEAKFGVLAASTIALDRFESFDGELGERFIKFRCRSNRSDLKVKKALANLGRNDSIRQEIEQAVADHLEPLSIGKPSINVPRGVGEALAIIADFAATARSPVARDRDHNLTYLPRPEVGTRLVKELAKLAGALAIVRGKTECGEAEMRTVTRVAEDCLPPNRLAVLRCLRRAASPITVGDVENATALSDATACRTLDDLTVLGLARHESLWELQPTWAARLQSVRILE